MNALSHASARVILAALLVLALFGLFATGGVARAQTTTDTSQTMTYTQRSDNDRTDRNGGTRTGDWYNRGNRDNDWYGWQWMNNRWIRTFDWASYCQWYIGMYGYANIPYACYSYLNPYIYY